MTGDKYLDALRADWVWQSTPLAADPVNPQSGSSSEPPSPDWFVFESVGCPSLRTAMDVARLFWFPCTVESTSTWFVWTEACHARRPTIPVPRSARGGPRDVRDRGLTISLRNVEYETPTSAEHVQKLVEELLADGGLQDWVRSLKTEARNVGASGSTLNQLDRGLLTAIASAQAGLVPGVIDAQSAASRLVQNLNVPLATAERSASTLLSQIPRKATASEGYPNASNTDQSGLGSSSN